MVAGADTSKSPGKSAAPSPLPVTSSQSGVYAQCGPDCAVRTVSDAYTSGAGDESPHIAFKCLEALSAGSALLEA